MAYVPLRKAQERLGLCANTLRKYADLGQIEVIKGPSGRRLFNCDSFISQQLAPHVICYARVSSKKQSDDLGRQIDRLLSAFPNAELIHDIGSGLNFKRKGLQALLGRVLRNEKLTLVVTHRDRLVRFGFDLFKFLIEQNHGQIVVLDNVLAAYPERELTSDLLAILHHFSCRMHGARSHKSQKDPNLPDATAKGDLQTLVGNFKEGLQQHRRVFTATQRRARNSLDGGSQGSSNVIARVGSGDPLSSKEDGSQRQL